VLIRIADVDRQAEVAVHQRYEAINQISHILERPCLLTISIDLLHQSHSRASNHDAAETLYQVLCMSTLVKIMVA